MPNINRNFVLGMGLFIFGSYQLRKRWSSTLMDNMEIEVSSYTQRQKLLKDKNTEELAD
ncbi:hypothetical protein DPMN_088457 [Dreissena polymorpha]|uniref:Uncharacterized protein n=1 Tax=Dreissena polymorpha TaxID=45954 RepID=A0A9D4KUL3_DREPO|nr:hypothetical protein DPMN_088457 [Dreissena polymorpha]